MTRQILILLPFRLFRGISQAKLRVGSVFCLLVFLALTAFPAVFEGNLVTDLTPKMQEEGFATIGYAAFKSTEISPPLDVDLYDAFQLRIKTDDRLYVVQVKTDSPYEEGTLD